MTVFQELISAERLSGGASQETYRIEVSTGFGSQLLAMRRAPGGVTVESIAGYPGLATEALLMESARDVGVPEPEVYGVLTPPDGLGDGFIMQWIEGEALGARIVRSAQFEEIRPKLAYECGKIMARIHAIDLKATGLDQKLAVIQPDEFIEQTWSRYKLFDTPQPMIDYSAKWLKQNLPVSIETTLVHNDFRNGNFMLAPEGITAVLDWEVAHIGDPMRDLGVDLHQFLAIRWSITRGWVWGIRRPVRRL